MRLKVNRAKLFCFGLVATLSISGVSTATLAASPGAFNQVDASSVIKAYVAHVHRSYRESHQSALAMHGAIKAFVERPSAKSLANARERWVSARVPYGETEVFRFYEGPIDQPKGGNSAEGPEGRLNAWPLNEAYLDGVKGKPKGGLINDTSVEITRDALIARNATEDEAEVTLGWHAIEFMLWGQDHNAHGPGTRSWKDFAGEGRIAQRRRAYLGLVSELLLEDLAGLVSAWAPGQDNYARTFEGLPAQVALSHIMSGMATLSGFDLASERIAVALDSRSQEDEHSCFSDTTHLDIWANALGVKKVYLGSDGASSAGVFALAVKAAPKEAEQLRALVEQSTALAKASPKPIDQALLAPDGDPRRVQLEALVTVLQKQAEALKALGGAMQIAVHVHAE